jgi:Zn-dependent protease with chaperone function
MATMIPYNRKINAPIRFLYYLEVFDLFILLIIGVLAPLFISTFLPVNIPLWHSLIWFVGIFLLLVIIKFGRAPGFVQHWFGKTFRAKSYHPGLKDMQYFLLSSLPQPPPLKEGDAVFTKQELHEVRASVLKLRQDRREADIMQEKTELV